MSLLLIAALFVQESVSTSAALFEMRRLGFDLLLVNVLWVLATVIDITVGYCLGRWVARRFSSSRFVVAVRASAGRLAALAGRHGERFAMFALGIIGFPYVNAFLFSWFDIPFTQVLLYIFAGSAVFWAFELGATLGVTLVAGTSPAVLYAVIVIFAFCALSMKFLIRRFAP